MAQPILSISIWVALPTETRYRIRDLFAIPRSQHVFVDDGRLMTDGTTPQDFQTLTIEKMQSFLQSDSTDFYKLFDLTVAKVQEDILNSLPTKMPAHVPEPEVPVTLVTTPNKPKNGKKTRK